MSLDWTLIGPVLMIIGLLCLSAFFSGSETSLTATSRARMLQMERDKHPGAAVVNKLIGDGESLLGSILLGNNLVNIAASMIAGQLFEDLLGGNSVLWATLIMTFTVLIFAEVLPKTYALSNPDRFALTVARPILLAVKVFAPVVRAVQVVVRGTLRIFGANVEGPVLSAHDELRGAIALHHEEGGVVKDDRDMLGGVLDLRELTVDDIMVHRKSILMIDADKKPAEIVTEALHSPHTRLPLYREDTENIVGILHVRDIARALHEADGDASVIDIDALRREPWFVPETTEVLDQLNAFREKREHFALVVDEYGALMGLVTLEDILEEIVGAIEDEHDIAVEGIQPDNENGSWLVDGAVPIRDLNRALDWELPDEEAVTIAGLVIHEAQTIPERGQVFQFHGARFEVVERRRNQITRLRVSVSPDELDAL
ncbi:HlyC/CorC family transporter [Maricaulis sp.]|uniref:HlyC/CorC family transporter n=1 Tax=Maricaulis sp. TaxID=1486257 RepID=UPI001B045575|nr:HlyC/CorC family transporter [Maricaulis sp.]MBO6766021.1 HlyC/CorC family transporter [Maricaulis sp.]